MTFDELVYELPEAEAGERVMAPADVRARIRRPGRILQRARELRGEHIEFTAARSGIAPSRLIRVESDIEKPSREELVRLAKHLDADVQVFLEAFGS